MDTPSSEDVLFSDKNVSEWDRKDETRKVSRWDATPLGNYSSEQTPKRSKSRWDQTPVHVLPALKTVDTNVTKPQFSTSFLDTILPSDGFIIVNNPSYHTESFPISKEHEKDNIPFEISNKFLMIGGTSELPIKKVDDYKFFAKLFTSEDNQTVEELKERKLLRLLLNIKNGHPQARRSSIKILIDKAIEFGPDVIFSNLLSLMLLNSVEETERHYFVKIIDRLLKKFGILVKPFVHKILIVIEPLLVEQNFFVRSEGREIISNLSKAVGLIPMITALRPDLDHVDENVRMTTAKSLSVVGAALGTQLIIPFLKAVCQSKKSWQARHTGLRTIQQLALILGCSVLPHLNSFMDCILDGLTDEQIKVRTMAGLAIAALAESSAPFGFDSFKPILLKLLETLRLHRGKALAAFLKAFGNIICIMPDEFAFKYSSTILTICSKEFQTTDDEMKRIILRVIKQCAISKGSDPVIFGSEIKVDFFKYFWSKKASFDRKNAKLLIDATVSIASKIDPIDIMFNLCHCLKSESDILRKLAADCLRLIIEKETHSIPNASLDQELFESILTCFEEYSGDDFSEILSCFSAIAAYLDIRLKPFILKISSMILWRLNNKSARIRMTSADLMAKIANVFRVCEEYAILSKISIILYENLGEEFPEVLGSILGALRSILCTVGINKASPSIKDLLPRLTPILRNRHEKVQENVIKLIGEIAFVANEAISPREWMRICFELVDILRAPKKSIRKVAIRALGLISKIVGPLDVINILLNNLKVQERQNRLCTTIAIAIVAENCGPFTVIPSLMNEYRVPELNVQNGVLKSFNFMFEYIAEMGKDYLYTISPLIEDALMERDIVHRQTATAIIKHIALDVIGSGSDDALLHLLNFCFPNIFEKSLHLFESVLSVIESLRLSLGPSIIFEYLLQGLFHPARKVRECYWKLYNVLYIGSQPCLISSYPRLESENVAFKSLLDISL